MASSSDEQQDFRRDLLKLLGLPFVAFALILAWWHPWSVTPYAASTPDEIFTHVAGTWDWKGADSLCVANPLTISFSTDRSVMYLAHRRPWTDSTGAEHRVAAYEIQSHSASQVRGRIRGETRLTDKGEPVVWDLVLTSPNTYAWHRTDWPDGGRTKEITRCPQGTDSLVPPP